jgi:hypothetical protein
MRVAASTADAMSRFECIDASWCVVWCVSTTFGAGWQSPPLDIDKDW